MQIGSQRVSSVICAKAKELLAQGIIGDLTLVEGSLGRNDPSGAWVYPPPSGLTPETFDWDTWQGTVPKRAFDANVFARWRCWKEYGTGVAGDLLVHLVSGMNFMLGWNEPPLRASSFGAILRFNDGRNMPDVQPTLFQYGKYPVYLRLNLGCETPEVYRFQGSKGYLEVTETTITYSPQTGKDESPAIMRSLAILAKCATPTSRNGTKNMIPLSARNLSWTDLHTRAIPGMICGRISGIISRQSARASL